MWLLIYRLLTWLVLSLIRIMLPLIATRSPKFAKWFRLRYWPEPLGFQPRLWIHAVSVGELNIAVALLGGLDKVDDDVLITTATHSGFGYLSEKLDRRRVRYLPWDMPVCYARMFEGVEVPNLVVVETELWPHLFRFVSDADARIALVNGRLSHKTLRYRKISLFADILKRVDAVGVRDTINRDRFLTMGLPADKVRITGNIKFDFQPKHLKEGALKEWLEASPAVLFASISADEIPHLAPTLLALYQERPQQRFLWAPRHLETLQQHLDALAPAKPILRSQLHGEHQPRLLILDSFGELSGCYGDAVLSVVGGSFNERGGQNFLESLQAGTPAVTGPSMHNFRREVQEALEHQAIDVLSGPEALKPALDALLDDGDKRETMAAGGRQFLAGGTGAIDRTRTLLIDLGVVVETPREES